MMNSTLTQEEKDLIRLSFTTGGFSMQDAVAKLKERGYDDETATAFIIAEFKEYKKELFERALKREKGQEMGKVMFILVIMVSLVGPLFGISSPLWYLVAAILCGIFGYVAYKDKPVAGVLGGCIFPIVFLMAYGVYFEGRTSFIKIEMAIPMVLAFIPSAIIYFLIAKLFYNNQEEAY